MSHPSSSHVSRPDAHTPPSTIVAAASRDAHADQLAHDRRTLYQQFTDHVNEHRWFWMFICAVFCSIIIASEIVRIWIVDAFVLCLFLAIVPLAAINRLLLTFVCGDCIAYDAYDDDDFCTMPIRRICFGLAFYAYIEVSIAIYKFVRQLVRIYREATAPAATVDADDRRPVATTATPTAAGQGTQAPR